MGVHYVLATFVLDSDPLLRSHIPGSLLLLLLLCIAVVAGAVVAVVVVVVVVVGAGVPWTSAVSSAEADSGRPGHSGSPRGADEGRGQQTTM